MSFLENVLNSNGKMLLELRKVHKIDKIEIDKPIQARRKNEMKEIIVESRYRRICNVM